MEASNIWASSSGMGDSGLGFEEFELEGPSRRLLASRVAGVGVGVFLFFFFL